MINYKILNEEVPSFIIRGTSKHHITNNLKLKFININFYLTIYPMAYIINYNFIIMLSLL